MEFSGDSLFLLAEVRYPLPQLGERDEFFLIGRDHAVNVVSQPRLLLT